MAGGRRGRLTSPWPTYIEELHTSVDRLSAPGLQGRENAILRPAAERGLNKRIIPLKFEWKRKETTIRERASERASERNLFRRCDFGPLTLRRSCDFRLRPMIRSGGAASGISRRSSSLLFAYARLIQVHPSDTPSSSSLSSSAKDVKLPSIFTREDRGIWPNPLARICTKRGYS